MFNLVYCNDCKIKKFCFACWLLFVSEGSSFADFYLDDVSSYIYLHGVVSLLFTIILIFSVAQLLMLTYFKPECSFLPSTLSKWGRRKQ